VTGTLDPDDKAALLDNGNFPLPGSPTYNEWGLGGGNNLGTIDRYSNTNLTYPETPGHLPAANAIGKMEAKAILQPVNIQNFVTNGAWKMKRTTVAIGWDNGGSPSLKTGGTIPPSPADDTSTVAASQYLNPVNGDIFDLDFPGVIVITHTADTYENFYEYTTVNLGNGDQVCSSTNTYSYIGQVDGDAGSVLTNVLSNSLISTLPTSSIFSSR